MLRSPFTLLKNMTALSIIMPAYYELMAIDIPLNSITIANPLFNDRFDHINKMYLGTTTPNDYILGTPVPKIAGRTFSLSGADAARFSINADGGITLVDNTSLTSGNLNINVVTNDIGTIPIVIPVVATNGVVLFYDSVAGDDANTGRQPHTPKKNYAGWVSGVTTHLFKRGTTISGNVITLINNITYGSYGDPSLSRPVLNGSSREKYTIRPDWKNNIPNSSFNGSSNVSILDIDVRAKKCKIKNLSQTSGVATAITDEEHGLQVGDVVVISGATPSAYNTNGGSGQTVTSIPTSKSFTYSISSGTSSPATGEIAFGNIVIIHAYNSANINIRRCDASGGVSDPNSSGIRVQITENATIRHCNINDYAGDGIYVTGVPTKFESGFNDVGPALGGAADCIQITGQNNFSLRCNDVWVHHCVLDYGRHQWTGSGKGALVIQETDRWCIEYNIMRGGYFACQHMGNRGTERANYYYDSNFYNPSNTNTWGTGSGADQFCGDHHSLFNIINSSYRGNLISGYPNAGGLQRFDRTDLIGYYNTIMNSNQASRATERWTGVQNNLHINNYDNTVSRTTGYGDTVGTVIRNVTHLSQSGGVAKLLTDRSEIEHTIRPLDTITIAGANEAVYNGTFTVSTVPTALVRSVVSLTQTAGVATLVTDYPHGMNTGDTVTIAGATPSTYNGNKTVTVVDATTLTFAIASGTSTPATGTITTSFNSRNVLTFAIDSGAASQATGTISVTKNLRFTTQVINVVQQNGLGPVLNTVPYVTGVTGGVCNDGNTLTVVTTAQTGVTYTYQWMLNGEPIVGATSASYTIPAGTAANTDKYMPQAYGLNTAWICCCVIATGADSRISYIPAKFDDYSYFQKVT